MTPSSSVTTWLAALKAGDPAAAEALWRRYFARLVELARQHLTSQVRRAADEEDVALSAFADFCAGAAAGRFPRLTNRHDLWQLLLTVTLRRAHNLVRDESRQRRDGRRTVGAGDLFDFAGGDLDRLVGTAPDPALAAATADQLRHLLAVLPGDDLRTIARDLLAGYTAVEIARRLGCGLRTVERRWQRIRQFWEPVVRGEGVAGSADER
jgi:DNA-directed RNA polymerase specialized sigma24 family protein